MRTREWIAFLSAGAAAGMIAGAAAGLGARAAMRMVADGVADGVAVRPDFTLAGTLAIVIFGALAGAPLGVLFNSLADRLRGPAAVRGLLFGVALLALIGPVFLRTEEFFSVGRVALFIPLFLVFGAVLGLALGPARSFMPRLPVPLQAIAGLAAAGTALLVGFGLVMTALGLPGAFVM
jgi:hypothetical protein